jgi:PIN domain nuclease of toxin-antitoxin system
MLVFAIAGDVTPKERAVLSADAWSISAIVLWELAKLVQLGRLDADLDDPELTRTLSALHVWPLDLAVCRQSTDLDFRGYSADELIAATSLVHSVPLLTRDRVIRKSKRVPLAV